MTHTSVKAEIEELVSEMTSQNYFSIAVIIAITKVEVNQGHQDPPKEAGRSVAFQTPRNMLRLSCRAFF